MCENTTRNAKIERKRVRKRTKQAETALQVADRQNHCGNTETHCKNTAKSTTILLQNTQYVVENTLIDKEKKEFEKRKKALFLMQIKRARKAKFFKRKFSFEFFAKAKHAIRS